MSDTFKVGSVVYLKSGGPAMTIIGSAVGGAQCIYFQKESELFHREVIPFEALTQSEP